MRARARVRALSLCAEQGRQLEGESPFDNLIEVKSSEAQGGAADKAASLAR
jgi:hypothetical protein